MNNKDYAKKEWLQNIEMHEESTWESVGTFILVAVAAIVWSIVFTSI